VAGTSTELRLPHVPLRATVGALILLAALSSLPHLGTAPQAWRAPGVGRVALASCGLLLVYAMAEVYGQI
jgi:hypothetical protein